MVSAGSVCLVCVSETVADEAPADEAPADEAPADEAPAVLPSLAAEPSSPAAAEGGFCVCVKVSASY